MSAGPIAVRTYLKISILTHDAVYHHFVPSKCKHYLCHRRQLHCLAGDELEERGLWFHSRRRRFRAALATGMGATDTKLGATRYLWRRMRAGSGFSVRGGLTQALFARQSGAQQV